MKKQLQIASAFIGTIIGAGFASGQEILQYFTSFGLVGILAILVSTLMFSYMGMTLTRLGSRAQARSHGDVIYRISGPYLGKVIDYILLFILFGIGVVMIAGGGSAVSQQFGLPFFVGALIMTLLVAMAVVNKVSRVVNIIGSITPLLILFVVAVSIYCLATVETPLAELNAIAAEQTPVISNWFMSALNYVSFNIAVGCSMAILMGGDEADEKTAAIGGLLGGLGVGILILLSNMAIFSKIDVVAAFDLPMLKIVSDLSPTLGLLYSFILLGMIFNTALSMFFSFGARFAEVQTRRFKVFSLATLALAFVLSFVGFTGLVSIFYPVFGYLGLLLMAALLYASIKRSVLPAGEPALSAEDAGRF